MRRSSNSFGDGNRSGNGGDVRHVVLDGVLADVGIVIAMVSGLIAGKILSLTGRRTEPYTDAEEFVVD